MSLASCYLDSAQTPTADDFDNFFRIFLLELQSLADSKKWNIFNPYHFSYFDYSCDTYYEVGVKAVLFSHGGEEFPFGVKCKISNGCLQFYIFDSKGILKDKSTSTITYEGETYIKGGYSHTYDSFIEYLDNVSGRVTELINSEGLMLKINQLPAYKIKDIKHIDEWVCDNTVIPF